MRNIKKRFPGVLALKNIDLDLDPGEVLALIGENGAGKSTLIKILGGAHPTDAGTVHIDNEPVQLRTPGQSQAAGIGIIYQEFNLVPYLTAAENIYLGQAKNRGGWIRRTEEHREAQRLFDRLGMKIDPTTLCAHLNIAEQQVVEIAKALAIEAKILVMDEPSATLTPQEVQKLLAIIRELQSQGIGVIYVSHRLDEVLEVADRVMVLRDGEHVDTRPITHINRRQMIELMVGRTMENEFPSHHHPVGKVRLRVEGLTRGKRVKNVSFEVRAGEILGITGLVGSGRTETARLLFGADLPDTGRIELDGNPLDLRTPRDAIKAGICLLTEDRKGEGLVLNHTVKENFALPNLRALSKHFFTDRYAEANALEHYVALLKIKSPDHNQSVSDLSGGNQQKVVLAKWLQRKCEVIIIDEPTRGIDVGTKAEIYTLMNDLAGQGKVIIMISSEMPEVLGMSDRILVMREGYVTGEITDVPSTTQEEIMELAAH